MFFVFRGQLTVCFVTSPACEPVVLGGLRLFGVLSCVEVLQCGSLLGRDDSRTVMGAWGVYGGSGCCVGCEVGKVMSGHVRSCEVEFYERSVSAARRIAVEIPPDRSVMFTPSSRDIKFTCK
ncbi:hypothetical protein ElyMa_005198500 [Elysia marginata]|uniref:Secreted protein n=1 Tax=Elysia marginata TaxID=1093978 RepID=A0AAV4JZG2_9GAST|nr:hypothetical protein ElyMa_005198500 [Elysia marginata]